MAKAKIPTPHIDAKKGEIAERILLPGDPLRAKYIAENFLTDVKQFNHTRNILGYTGKYGKKKVSVMGTGMGCPSIGIYSYELINFYGVKKLIRVGTTGAMTDRLHIGDLVLAQAACFDGAMPTFLNNLGSFAPIASYDLLEAAAAKAREKGMPYLVGNVLTSDYFYGPKRAEGVSWSDMGVLAVEMECFMLYLNAIMYHAQALGILTVSDSLVTGEKTTAEQREKSFTNMMELALEII